MQTGEWALGDPATEDISRIIDSIIHKEYRGYKQTTTEVILSGATSIITKLIGLTQHKHICKNTVLLKTVITPVVDLTTRAQYEKSANFQTNKESTMIWHRPG